MVCVVYFQSTTQSGFDGLGGSKYTRQAQKLTLNINVCQVDFYLTKVSTPTGNASATIRKTSDDSIIETSGDTLDVSTISSPAYSWYTFTFNSVVNEEVRVCIEYNGGNATKFVRVGKNTGGGYTGQGSRSTLGAWADVGGDLNSKIYQTLVSTTSGSIVPQMVELIQA